MGTRADFYVGRGKEAEWIGSIAFDGYPGGNPKKVLMLETEGHFRDGVTELLDKLHHGTKPEDGWPWPWDTSRTTDYAYAFDSGSVWVSHFGSPWKKAGEPGPEPPVFPVMDSSKPTLGKRSGIIVVE